jgi:hypothetical protein
MRAKNIKAILRKKFNDFLASVDDEAVREAIRKDGLITGGSIASMLLGDKPSDYDVYFKTKATTAAVAKYYVAKWKANPPARFKDHPERVVNITVDDEGERVKIIVKSMGVASEGGAENYQYFEQVDNEAETQDFIDHVMADAAEATAKSDKPKYRPVFLTTNAITLSDDIQLVIRFYGDVSEIHENYDFIHCTCAWDAATGELSLPPAALESLLSKDLRYKRSKYPLCSLIRTRKFLNRGWKINAGQYVKMAWDLNKLDLSNPAVLEDQMVGVDAAYFLRVLDELKKTGADKIDETYLMEVIDRIF